MIAIIDDEENGKVGETVFRQIREKTEDVQLLNISTYDIKPCYCCGGCEKKTYGRCVVRDDMDIVLPAMARAEVLIIITKVMWGAPSYNMKKLLDKSSLLGNRFYKYRNGEIVKGTNAATRKMVFIGVTARENLKHTHDFVFWSNEMGKILDVKRYTEVITLTDFDNRISDIVYECLTEMEKR